MGKRMGEWDAGVRYLEERSVFTYAFFGVGSEFSGVDELRYELDNEYIGCAEIVKGGVRASDVRKLYLRKRKGIWDLRPLKEMERISSCAVMFDIYGQRYMYFLHDEDIAPAEEAIKAKGMIKAYASEDGRCDAFISKESRILGFRENDDFGMRAVEMEVTDVELSNDPYFAAAVITVKGVEAYKCVSHMILFGAKPKSETDVGTLKDFMRKDDYDVVSLDLMV
jgi:hypothetical protein